MDTELQAAAAPWLLAQLRCGDTHGLREGLPAFAAAAAVRIHRAAWCAETGQAYVYLRTATAPSADAPQLAALLRGHCAGAHEIRLSPLAPVFETPGASANQAPRFHYVVETDPEDGWLDEIARWYDQEHMPGLAAVPGCVRAMRFLNRGHGPVSLAGYDLVTRETLGSPPWLAVRATAWSDIARPHFTHTRRTMFELLDLDAPGRASS